MEDTEHLKMYFLWNMRTFQFAMLVYQRIFPWVPGVNMGNGLGLTWHWELPPLATGFFLAAKQICQLILDL